jgi:hypothetical protein
LVTLLTSMPVAKTFGVKPNVSRLETAPVAAPIRRNAANSPLLLEPPNARPNSLLAAFHARLGLLLPEASNWIDAPTGVPVVSTKRPRRPDCEVFHPTRKRRLVDEYATAGPGSGQLPSWLSEICLIPEASPPGAPNETSRPKTCFC